MGKRSGLDFEIVYLDKQRGIAEITISYRETEWTDRKTGKKRIRRYIPIPPIIAEQLGLKDKDFVRVRIEKVSKK